MKWQTIISQMKEQDKTSEKQLHEVKIGNIPEKEFKIIIAQMTSVQSLSHFQILVTPWTAAHQASLSITNSRSLLKLMSIKSVMPSNHLILCRLHLLLPSIFPSIKIFSNKSGLLIRWPKYWSFIFSFSISPSNEYPELISFRMDWLDLLAVQGTLKRSRWELTALHWRTNENQIKSPKCAK